MDRVTFILCALLATTACKTTPPEPQNAAEPEKAPAPAPVASVSAAVNDSSAAAPSDAAAVSGSASATASAAPSATPSATPAPSGSAASAAKVEIPAGHHKVLAKPTQPIQPSPDDPLKGAFSLADATQGLTGKGKLMADIKTPAGKLECELFDDRAPLTVANFIGLARGIRPFKSQTGEWVKKPAYDGTTFHRIIKGFMIQGGDPAGTGAGEPGYVIPDEIWEDAYHSERGLLCMANRGPNTNGQQFFIMDGSAPHLDGGYTIFGKCAPSALIEKLANSEVQGDRAVTPPKIEKVTVRRGVPKKP